MGWDRDITKRCDSPQRYNAYSRRRIYQSVLSVRQRQPQSRAKAFFRGLHSSRTMRRRCLSAHRASSRYPSLDRTHTSQSRWLAIMGAWCCGGGSVEGATGAAYLRWCTAAAMCQRPRTTCVDPLLPPPPLGRPTQVCGGVFPTMIDSISSLLPGAAVTHTAGVPVSQVVFKPTRSHHTPA